MHNVHSDSRKTCFQSLSTLCTNVQRRTKYGLNYNGTDFVVNGSSELVARSDWGSNYYGARLEESFIRYQFVSPTGGWAATQKDGTKYYYGQI